MEIVTASERSFVPAGHEDPNNPGVWKRILYRKEELQPGTVQMVNWARLPAGKSFSAHYHEDMQEIFIIIRGTARIVVDRQSAELRPGDSIRIDAREIHRMWNDGTEDVEYVVLGISSGEGGQTVVIQESE
jgi:mannose-6-phosphate isomerase-like protein (cupin superfamily)